MTYRKPFTSWDEVPIIMDLPMAARIVGYAPEYLKKLCLAGNFPAFKVGENGWRVDKADLRGWIQNRRRDRKIPQKGYVPWQQD